MKIHYLIFILFHTWVGTCFAQLANSLPVQSQSRLTQCTGKDRGLWLNCNGNLKLPNGDRYVGEFQAGKPNGKGTLIFKNGDKYVGGFKDIKFNGIGTYTYANGAKYMGEFKDNKYEGKGILIAANGDKYEGNFKEDKFNGKGILIAANGDKYEGNFKEDKFNGNGTLSGFNGDKYIGEFKDDKYEGKGIFISVNGNKYEGNFKEDKYHGFGTYTFANGAKYSGEYKDGKRNGKGTLSDINGEIVAGDFKDGFKNGQVTYTFSNGDKYDGEFKDDKSVGKGTFTLANGEKFVALLSERDRLLAEQKAKEQQRIVEEARAKEQQRLAIEAQQKEQNRILAEQRAKEQQRIAEEAQQVTPIPTQTASTGAVGRRIALVVGNANYKVRPLKNSRNDADDVSRSLKTTGFEVIDLRDATLPQMRTAVRQFGDRLINNDVGLVYYSGHGVEVKGRNYFIPVNADIQREDEIADQGLDVSLILEKMSTAGKGVNILIVDACRDDPFGRSFRSSSRGLAQMDAPRGTIIAYATSPGKVASDGDPRERNSPYTKHLVKAMQSPNKPIEQVFKEVRRAVQDETKNQQTPWENTSLSGDFFFKVLR